MRKVKDFVRRIAPGFYDQLILAAYGPTARKIRGFPKRLKFQQLVRSEQPFCIDLSDRQGFGGLLTTLILVHSYLAKVPGLKRVTSSNPLYIDKGVSPDVLEMFFDRVDPAPVKDCVVFPYLAPEDMTLQVINTGLTINAAHDLFFQHYQVKKQFLDEAKQFFESNFSNVLGVHFRGSDKRLEATRVEYETYTKAVDTWMEATGIESLFIATDEVDFLKAMQSRYGEKRTKALDCKYYSDGVRGSHYLGGPGFEKGREALLTMLILSMCNVCIRGASHLSAWSKVFNPKLPIVMLGKPFYRTTFPEGEMLRAGLKSPMELSQLTHVP